VRVDHGVASRLRKRTSFAVAISIALLLAIVFLWKGLGPQSRTGTHRFTFDDLTVAIVACFVVMLIASLSVAFTSLVCLKTCNAETGGLIVTIKSAIPFQQRALLVASVEGGRQFRTIGVVRSSKLLLLHNGSNGQLFDIVPKGRICLFYDQKACFFVWLARIR
jgi:hypothetical protein